MKKSDGKTSGKTQRGRSVPHALGGPTEKLRKRDNAQSQQKEKADMRRHRGAF